jgi:hypothetical protein
MKFKLIYDEWIRLHPIKPSNQQVISSFQEYKRNDSYKKKYSKIVKERNNSDDDKHINEYEIDLDADESDENENKI